MILVSACLLGEDCKYSGGNNYNHHVKKYLSGKEVIRVCPEVLGQLETPRAPAEIQGGDGYDVLAQDATVIDREGRDVTTNFITGAKKTLSFIESDKCKLAILKSRSPSCGSQEIYDGSFSGKKKKGVGVATALLEEAGIKVINEEEIDELMKIDNKDK